MSKVDNRGTPKMEPKGQGDHRREPGGGRGHERSHSHNRSESGSRDHNRGDRNRQLGQERDRSKDKEMKKEKEIKDASNQQDDTGDGKSTEEKKFTGRCRLFVGNLTPDVSEDEFKKMFTPYGEVSEVYVNTGRGFGFIRLDFRHNAEAAKNALDGQTRKGRVLRVRYATHGAALRVKNLHPYVSNELLEQAFTQFGDLERAVVIVDDRGKPTGEGLVEFVRKPGAQQALRRINEGVFLFGADPKPIEVEPLEQKDEEDGMPEKFVPKNDQYKTEREKEPHFAAPGSFQYEFGMRWKQLDEMEKQRLESVKKEMEEARIKLEDEMQNALYEFQAEQIRQDLLRQQEELRRLEQLRDNERMRRQQELEVRMSRRQEEDRQRQMEDRRRQEIMMRQQDMQQRRSGGRDELMGGMRGGDMRGDMPGGMRGGDMPGGMRGGDMPGGMRGGDMPGGMRGGDMSARGGPDMPGGMQRGGPDMPGGMRGGPDMPGGMRGGDMPGGMRGGDMRGGDMPAAMRGGPDMRGGDIRGEGPGGFGPQGMRGGQGRPEPQPLMGTPARAGAPPMQPPPAPPAGISGNERGQQQGMGRNQGGAPNGEGSPNINSLVPQAGGAQMDTHPPCASHGKTSTNRRSRQDPSQFDDADEERATCYQGQQDGDQMTCNQRQHCIDDAGHRLHHDGKGDHHSSRNKGEHVDGYWGCPVVRDREGESLTTDRYDSAMDHDRFDDENEFSGYNEQEMGSDTHNCDSFLSISEDLCEDRTLPSKDFGVNDGGGGLHVTDACSHSSDVLQQSTSHSDSSESDRQLSEPDRQSNNEYWFDKSFKDPSHTSSDFDNKITIGDESGYISSFSSDPGMDLFHSSHALSDVHSRRSSGLTTNYSENGAVVDSSLDTQNAGVVDLTGDVDPSENDLVITGVDVNGPSSVCDQIEAGLSEQAYSEQFGLAGFENSVDSDGAERFDLEAEIVTDGETIAEVDDSMALVPYVPPPDSLSPSSSPSLSVTPPPTSHTNTHHPNFPNVSAATGFPFFPNPLGMGQPRLVRIHPMHIAAAVAAQRARAAASVMQTRFATMRQQATVSGVARSQHATSSGVAAMSQQAAALGVAAAMRQQATVSGVAAMRQQATVSGVATAMRQQATVSGVATAMRQQAMASGVAAMRQQATAAGVAAMRQQATASGVAAMRQQQAAAAAAQQRGRATMLQHMVRSRYMGTPVFVRQPLVPAPAAPRIPGPIRLRMRVCRSVMMTEELSMGP